MDGSIAGPGRHGENLAIVRRLLLLASLLAFAPAALASGVDFEARLWAPDLSGVARVGNGGAGTAIDLASDLGFADDESLEGRLVWRPTRRTSVRLGYSSFDFTGDARLDRAVTFGDTTFQLDAQVGSLLELEYGGVGFAWQLLSTPDSRVRFGPLVEIRGLRGEAAISTELLGIVPLSAREEFELGFGAAGLVLDVEPSRRVHLWARWTASVETDEGDLTDAEAGMRFYLMDTLAITVGYRRIEIDAADGNDLFDLELDGPFFGGVLRF